MEVGNVQRQEANELQWNVSSRCTSRGRTKTVDSLSDEAGMDTNTGLPKFATVVDHVADLHSGLELPRQSFPCFSCRGESVGLSMANQ
jgi:hypothetical protein